jgi:hypothetical protein
MYTDSQLSSAQQLAVCGHAASAAITDDQLPTNAATAVPLLLLLSLLLLQ